MLFAPIVSSNFVFFSIERGGIVHGVVSRNFST